jgi:hypothetical protein
MTPDQIICGYGNEADYFVCLRKPRFIAEFDIALFLTPATPFAGAEQKDGGMMCQVIEWLDDPLDGEEPDNEAADRIARHVRLAFDEAMSMQIEDADFE